MQEDFKAPSFFIMLNISHFILFSRTLLKSPENLV